MRMAVQLTGGKPARTIEAPAGPAKSILGAVPAALSLYPARRRSILAIVTLYPIVYGST